MKQVLSPLLALVLASTVACASVSRLNQSAETLVRQSIVQSEANRCTVHATPCLTDDQFKAVNVELNKVAVDGREFTKIERAGKATVKDVSTFITTVTSVSTTLKGVYTDGAIATVLDALTQLQATLVKLIGKL